MTSIFRSLAATLALSAMLVRALLPAGWMPNLAGTGAPLVICSVDGLHHLPSQNPLKGHDEGSVCPFAAATHLASPPGTATLLVPHLVAFVSAPFVAPTARAHLHDPGHAPRAPPVSV